MKRLKSIVSTLLNKPSDAPATDGPGETYQLNWRGYREGCTCAKCVQYLYLTRRSSLTTSSQSLTPEQGSKGSTGSSKDSFQFYPAGRLSAEDATISRPEEKMSEEKPLEKQEGVKHDQGKNRLDLISPIAIEELGKVLTFGAKKYSARNWENGISWTRCIGAVLRHTFAYLKGETHDPETGLSHLAHAMCECMFVIHFEATRPEFDDRPKYNGENK